MLKKQLTHAFQNLLAAVFIIVIAAPLSKTENYLTDNHYPHYMIVGAHLIAIWLFIVDGIVVCGTCGIVAYKMLAAQISKPSSED
jgi:hypothetical protein